MEGAFLSRILSLPEAVVDILVEGAVGAVVQPALSLCMLVLLFGHRSLGHRSDFAGCNDLGLLVAVVEVVHNFLLKFVPTTKHGRFCL